jgi:hypothetical protein
MNAAEQQIKDWHEEEMERLFQEEQQAKRNERAAEINRESADRIR